VTAQIVVSHAFFSELVADITCKRSGSHFAGRRPVAFISLREVMIKQQGTSVEVSAVSSAFLVSHDLFKIIKLLYWSYAVL
jgi:hypothetical protein